MTPVCNCPADIGWLPEAAWPFGEACKASAQNIYCVAGNPVVPPGGRFLTSPYGGDGRIDYDGAPIQPDPASNPGNPIPLAIPGGSVTNITFNNDSCYSVRLFATVAMDAHIGIASPQAITYSPRITGSGGMAFVIAGAGAINYGDGTGSLFRQYGYTTPLPGLLAPGANVTVVLDVPAYYTSGGNIGLTGFTKISASVRLFGGRA